MLYITFFPNVIKIKNITSTFGKKVIQKFHKRIYFETNLEIDKIDEINNIDCKSELISDDSQHEDKDIYIQMLFDGEFSGAFVCKC